MSNIFSIFMSHVEEDETIALAIKQYLETVFLNAQVFVAGRDLTGGEVWIKEIKDKLQSSSIVVSIITPYSIKSPWVLFESGAGFLDSKTIPLCADGITLTQLEPPLKLLQARVASQDGLKTLVRDVAKLAQLRQPTQFPGLEDAFASIEEFIALRNQADKEQKPEVNEAMRSETGATTAVKKSNLDAEIKEEAERLAQAARVATIKSILRAEGKYDIPSKDDLERMEMTDLREIAEYANVPTPPVSLRLTLMNFQIDPLHENASKWKKMNARKGLEEAFRELEKFVKSL